MEKLQGLEASQVPLTHVRQRQDYRLSGHVHATWFRHKRLDLRGWFFKAAVAAKAKLDLIKGWGREKLG
jgi:hypothetical protein